MRIPASKIAMPDLPTGFTSRPHLLEQLDRCTGEQLLAVIAPAGYGKTALLAEWVRHRCGPRSAWVSLDAADDAPRLRSALLAALRAIPDLPADSPLREVGRGAGDWAGLDVVDELAAALDATSPAIRVVLDDVHELTAPEALRDLARLIRRRPAGLRLVLAGRADPPLPLPRMRLEGRLHELRAAELRFTVDDTAALLHASGLDVTAQQVAVLHARTGGWAAGLRLAALALRGRDDPQGFIAHFSGSECSVADYLTDEVMAALPEQTRQFLRVSAVCSELPAGLAVALSRRADAERVLDELARCTSLVEPTEPGTYRIHTLLRTYLVTELERQFPALHSRVHAIAARWWLDADDPVHALRHAERAGEPALVLDLLRARGVQLVATGRLPAVRRALDAAGPAARAADPWPALLAALVHHGENSRSDVVAALAQARRMWPPDADPALDVLRASVELLATGRGPAEPPAGPPGAVPPELDTLLRLSEVAAAMWADGADADDLRARLEGVAALSREHGLPYFEVWALSLLAALEMGRGRYRAMRAAATAAVAGAVGQGRHPADWTAGAVALIAYGDLLAGDPASARSRTEAVLATGAHLGPDAELTLRVVHGTALGDMGEPAAGLAACQLARADHGAADAPAPLLAALAVLEHRAALAHGGPGPAAETAEWLERRVGKVGEVLLMDAWAHLLAGRPESARAAVEPLAAGSVAALVPYTPVEMHLVRAEAALHRGNRDEGRAELGSALALGSVLEVVRPFALVSTTARDLLESTRPAGTSARLLTALSAIRADVTAPLSERELAVLALLSSLLSAVEIADELTVSVNTVKSHIRSIYGKLGVSTRRDAVRRAHECNLFT